MRGEVERVGEEVGELWRPWAGKERVGGSEKDLADEESSRGRT